jgi:hypothetical protein
MAYVAKAYNSEVIRFARLKITDPGRGFYMAKSRGKFAFSESGGSYLFNNPSYHYYWVDSSPTIFHPNAVAIKLGGANGPTAIVTRIQENGQTNIDLAFYGGGSFYMGPDGVQQVIENYQVLVCDPKPVNPCSKSLIEF